jgi:MFS family permease
VASNVGTWMQNVGAAWLMTSLAPSPSMVALVQAATTLPVFLLALLAGALADVVDRRRLLLITQSWMLLAAASLGVLTIIGATTPWVLLALTFALGLGVAMNGPAWQAIIPELVSRDDLHAAVALNGVGFNLARAVGPALGGVIVATAGSGAVFLINAASFVGVVIVLYRWPRAARKTQFPTEDVLGAMRAGLRYVRHAPDLRAVLVRSGVFIFCGAALWALLPLLARSELGLGATGYGVLLGCLGAGAVLCAAVLPRLQKSLRNDPLIAVATLLFAAATLTLAYVHNFPTLCAAMIAGGSAWMALMSSFNVSAQTSVPAWVRARALALYLLVIQGGMAGGSVLWGIVAERVGIPMALLIAALGLVLGIAAAARYPLRADDEMDLTPSMHWPDPQMPIEPHPRRGPVLVTVEYVIATERGREFAEVMRNVRQQRLRDGALRWGLFHDPLTPAKYLETFVVESWAEHMRQHERVTVSDRVMENRALAFHIGDKPPVVSHLISAYSADDESDGNIVPNSDDTNPAGR